MNPVFLHIKQNAPQYRFGIVLTRGKQGLPDGGAPFFAGDRKQRFSGNRCQLGVFLRLIPYQLELRVFAANLGLGAFCFQINQILRQFSRNIPYHIAG